MKMKMKRKVVSLLVVVALAIGLFVGCGSNGDNSKNNGESNKNGTEVDLSKLTFGPYNWPVDPGIDYTQSWAKRFDGMEYTRVVNTGGNEVPEGQTVDENGLTWAFESVTGLKSTSLWEATGSAYTQKLNQVIASGEIPDLMNVNLDQYYMLVKSGLIADLTDELRSGAHPTLDKMYSANGYKALDVLEVEGKIYGIPRVNASFDGSPMVWIRKDWMEKLNLKAPKTIADLAGIAKRFMEADMDGNGQNDSYGIPVLANFNASYGGDGALCDIFLNIGGAAPGLWQKQEDGTIIYGSLMDGAKEALTLLNSWYKEGIIPSDFATWNKDDLKQAVGNGKAGIVFSPWWGSASVLNNNLSVDSSAEWVAYMLPAEEGGEIRSAAGNPVTSIYVVSKDFEDPSAFVYAYDLWNSTNTSLTSYEGYKAINNAYNPMSTSVPPELYIQIGETFEKVASGELATVEEASKYILEVSGIPNDSRITNMFAGKAAYDALQAGKNPRDVAAEGKDKLFTYQKYLQWIVGPVALKDGNPTAVSTVYQGNTASMDSYSSFLADYEKEAYVNMIMGNTKGQSISDYFDDFVESYLEQGGKAITAEVKEVLGK